MEVNSDLEVQSVSVVIKEEKYSNDFHQCLMRQRKSGDFCDAVLMATSGSVVVRIPVHRTILAAASAFFYALFTTELNEPNQKEFTLNEIDAEILGQLIDFYYTGLLTLNDDNVQALLQWANLYIFVEIVDHCSKYLCNKVEPSNCIGMWSIADAYKLDRLQSAARSCFADNFTVVSECDEFLNTALGKVIECLKLDHLNIHSEEDVLDAALHWINHESDQRAKHFSTLMDYVRLSQINRSVIQKKITPYSEIVGSSADKIQNILQQKLPRNCYPVESFTTSRLVAFGGGSRNIEYFCPISNRWQHWHQMPFDDMDYDAVAHGSKLYMFFPTTKKIVEFDIVLMKTIREKELDISAEIDIDSCRLTVKCSTIYIIFGGRSTNLCVYQYKKDSFEQLDCTRKDEKLHRIRLASYFWPYGNAFYIFGITSECIPKVYAFDSGNDEFIVSQETATDENKCAAADTVVCYKRDCILSIGSNSVLNTHQRSVQLLHKNDELEEFDPQIENRKALDEGVNGMALAVHVETVYAAGGKYETTGTVPSKRFRQYDPATDVWTEMPPMLNGRFRAKLITIPFPRHLVD